MKIYKIREASEYLGVLDVDSFFVSWLARRDFCIDNQDKQVSNGFVGGDFDSGDCLEAGGEPTIGLTMTKKKGTKSGGKKKGGRKRKKKPAGFFEELRDYLGRL